MKDFPFKILVGILTIFLADKIIPNVSLKIISEKSNFFGIPLKEYWQILILIGVTLGILNFFVKPILDKITFLLRLLTFGIFGIILNMLILWVLDILFLELEIVGISPLFLAALLSMAINFLLKFIL